VDGVDFEQYEVNLTTNLANLVERLKGKQYRAKLVRRKHIPKPGGKLRPLGIPVIEDKLLHMAAASVLSANYEQGFLETSWGYRPGRGPRQASRVLAGRLAIGRYHWIVEADIRGFFDRISHEWMLKMLGERVNDSAFLNLIRKWLRIRIYIYIVSLVSMCPKPYNSKGLRTGHLRDTSNLLSRNRGESSWLLCSRQL
jgi:RNA-directed DNA polymerase